jgi:hypothetical protein
VKAIAVATALLAASSSALAVPTVIWDTGVFQGDSWGSLGAANNTTQSFTLGGADTYEVTSLVFSYDLLTSNIFTDSLGEKRLGVDFTGVAISPLVTPWSYVAGGAYTTNGPASLTYDLTGFTGDHLMAPGDMLDLEWYESFWDQIAFLGQDQPDGTFTNMRVQLVGEKQGGGPGPGPGPVPAPASLALLGLGLAALRASRRRLSKDD